MKKKFIPWIMAMMMWLPCLSYFFHVELHEYKQDESIAPKAFQIAERHLRIWKDPQLRAHELKLMQRRNPEWDFMSRMYFILALTNMAFHDSTYKPLALEIIDVIIEDTLDLEKERGHHYFLLHYAKQSTWSIYPPRSLFIDGEIAVMIAARRFLEDKEEYKKEHQRNRPSGRGGSVKGGS